MDVKRKRPIIISSSNHNHVDDKRFDIRLKEGFKLFVAGPSRSGKTYFIDTFITSTLGTWRPIVFNVLTLILSTSEKY